MPIFKGLFPKYKTPAWLLYWVVIFGLPVYLGLFNIDRIGCKICTRDIVQYCFSIFGYIVFAGFCASLTKPYAKESIELKRESFDTREGALRMSVSIGLFFVVLSLFAIYG